MQTSNVFIFKGFGVCCIFEQMTCGGTVSENCTYIQNEGYDTGYSPGDATETCVVSMLGRRWHFIGHQEKVLLVNVSIPTFVSFLSTVHILSYFCPVSVSHLSHFCPLSRFCRVFVFKFSISSWSGLVFVIIGLKTVPLLSSFGPLSPWQVVRTNTGQS